MAEATLARNDQDTAIHPVDRILPIGQLLIYGLQHVLAMYAGAVAVPLIVAISIGIGLISLGSPTFYHKFPDWLQIILNSGISAGSITAILLNLFLNGTIRSTTVGTPAPSEPEADRAEVLPTQLSVDVE